MTMPQNKKGINDNLFSDIDTLYSFLQFVREREEIKAIEIENKKEQSIYEELHYQFKS